MCSIVVGVGWGLGSALWGWGCMMGTSSEEIDWDGNELYENRVGMGKTSAARLRRRVGMGTKYTSLFTIK